MKVIRFRRLDSNYWLKRGLPTKHPQTGQPIAYWEIAFNEAHLRDKLDGEMAEIIMPARPWFVQLWRRFFPLKFTEIRVKHG